MSSPPRTLVPERFEAQVRRTPDAPALVDGPLTLTYTELNERANHLAHHLIGRGVGPERLVAVRMPRSADLVVALLAVLKAGAAYVPIEPGYPPERVAFMLSDAQPSLVLTVGSAAGGPGDELVVDRPETRAALSAGPKTDPGDADRREPLRGNHAAYVIYTSGSTGRPKGVVIEHDAFGLYLAYACATYPGLAGGALLHSPIAFDLTVTALYGPLVSGGYVEVVDLTGAPPSRRPTFLKVTPAHLAMLSALPPEFSPTGDLVVGGELLLGEVVDEWRRRHPGVTVINEYGPTEATVGCCVFIVRPEDRLAPGGVLIGRATWRTGLHVLDGSGRPAPDGEVGELHIAGDQLARGYLNRPELTAERFVEDASGVRMYRTGDLVRRTASGDLDYLGRTDDQVKIDGYRIELAEIESVLTRHPDVAQAAVVPYRRGDVTRLAGYLVPVGELDLKQVRKHAEATLPQYMTAALRLMTVPVLALTPNGKVDRKALPSPEPADLPAALAPRTPAEEALCRLAAGLLGVSEVSADADFFAVGGNSVLAARLVGTLRAAGVPVSLRDVFTHRTIEALARRVPAGAVAELR